MMRKVKIHRMPVSHHSFRITMNFPEIQLNKFSKFKQLRLNKANNDDKGKCSTTRNLNIIKMVRS